ncbi:MAG: beta-lactamase family protein [Clostridia bacterium]|nr:beta-lactamase family protein [Clostridia bacterium]
MNRFAKEIIVISVILIVSICISIPSYIKNDKEYKVMREKEEANSKDWVVSTPESQGMNPEVLKRADKVLKRTDALSFLVVRHGRLVHESYYSSAGRDDYNNVFSVTKSFISALTGIAIDRGYIKGIDEKINIYLQGYYSQINDTRKEEITIKHLLTMTPGFVEDFSSWTGSTDWIKHTIRLPLKYDPGQKFQYANSASHLLSAVLTKAVGKSMSEFADQCLFNELGIKDKKWTADPQGYTAGHANLYLRPRDMAKFGLLYLNKGMWNNKRVLSAEWVEESTKKHVDTEPEKTRGTPTGYGYKWWTFEEKGYYIYAAAGFGGQYICIIPDLDIVLVTTSLPGRRGSLDDNYRSVLIKEYIIPSVNDKQ